MSFGRNWAELTENSIYRVWIDFSGHGYQVENECSSHESRRLLAWGLWIEDSDSASLRYVYSSIFSINFSIKIFLFLYSWLICFWFCRSWTFSIIVGFSWIHDQGPEVHRLRTISSVYVSTFATFILTSSRSTSLFFKYESSFSVISLVWLSRVPR